MAFDSTLIDRIRKAIARDHRFSEKTMFGGLAFMLGDKMCVGVLKDKLVARIGPIQSELALRKPYVSPMDFTGRPLKGYVYVSAHGIKTEKQLVHWIELSIAFTSTLMAHKRQKRRMISDE